ncbi:MAG: hypothetical protein WC789_10470 [Lentisphaeria bacterium]
MTTTPHPSRVLSRVHHGHASLLAAIVVIVTGLAPLAVPGVRAWLRSGGGVAIVALCLGGVAVAVALVVVALRPFRGCSR